MAEAGKLHFSGRDAQCRCCRREAGRRRLARIGHVRSEPDVKMLLDVTFFVILRPFLKPTNARPETMNVQPLCEPSTARLIGLMLAASFETKRHTCRRAPQLQAYRSVGGGDEESTLAHAAR
jgi:hypothetical protein